MTTTERSQITIYSCRDGRRAWENDRRGADFWSCVMSVSPAPGA